MYFFFNQSKKLKDNIKLFSFFDLPKIIDHFIFV